MSESSAGGSQPDLFDSTLARTLADDLLSIGAVTLRPRNPFTWTSGLIAPIYCDNRRTLAHPRIRRSIAAGFSDLVTGHQLVPAIIAGTATAGIPHAAWLAERVDAPMVYVRSGAKGHGRGERIEGRDLGGGDRVIVVEDLVSTGGSALDAVSAVRATGAAVSAVLAIFTYELDVAARAFRKADVPCHVLTTFSMLVDVAREQGRLSDDELKLLTTWRADPAAWSAERGGAANL